MNPTKRTAKRMLAFTIDYPIIILYASALYGLSLLFQSQFQADLSQWNPLKGQLVGFFTLSLPVFLYFYLSERGKYGGTVGKRLMKLSVVPVKEHGSANPVLIRNMLKFLPWEIAHGGVHWLFYYEQRQLELPYWNLLLLILPQLMILIYLISIWRYKGEGSLYDKIAGTKVIAKP
ncbi:hypothetical protein GWK08_11860 [Leptobacterium flavescens]|uniref:RDD domain-containing protein n=1 Tax=Leptobacterium flavescens TaxID=472055 RepID=A0A6P0UNX5_9FLAO|nr:RDD family protein [Leptobacterium flavescens]NER14140.1 hypothetical protein [Leptobacterium flavescens]